MVALPRPRPVSDICVDILRQKETNLKDNLIPGGADWTQNTRVISACCSSNLVYFACVLMEGFEGLYGYAMVGRSSVFFFNKKLLRCFAAFFGEI